MNQSKVNHPKNNSRIVTKLLLIVVIFCQHAIAQRYTMTIYNQWLEQIMFKNADVLNIDHISPVKDSFPRMGITLISDIGKSPIHVRDSSLPIRLGQIKGPGLYEFDIVDTSGPDKNYLFAYSLNEHAQLRSRVNYKFGSGVSGRDTLSFVLDTLERCLSKIAQDTVKKRLSSILGSYSAQLDSSSSFGFAAIITRNEPVILVCTEQDRNSARDSAIKILKALLENLTILFSTEKSDVVPTSTFIADPGQEMKTLDYWMLPGNYETRDTHLYEIISSGETVRDLAKLYPDESDPLRDLLWFGFEKRNFGQFIILFRLVNKK